MKTVKIIEAITPLVAMIAIAVLEVFAIRAGIDGLLFSGVVLAIGALGGYQAKKVKDRIKHNE